MAFIHEVLEQPAVERRYYILCRDLDELLGNQPDEILTEHLLTNALRERPLSFFEIQRLLDLDAGHAENLLTRLTEREVVEPYTHLETLFFQLKESKR